MDILAVYAIVGLVINRAVYAARSFDKGGKVPTSYWLILSWALGIGVAYLLCNVDTFEAFRPTGSGCVGQVLVGLGFGSVAGFWHYVLEALPKRVPVEAPKGFTSSK